MAKLPSFQFYPGDWMKDPALRSVSISARGLWIDMLCLMHEGDRRGYLKHATGKPVTHEQLARMTGCSSEEVSRLLQELEDSGVLSCTEHGTYYSRRMVRDETKRQKCSEAGKSGGGNPTFKGQGKGESKGDAKGDSKQKPNPSSSSSSSNQDINNTPARKGLDRPVVDMAIEQYAQRAGKIKLGIDLQLEAERCFNYYTGRGTQVEDWQALFKNWILAWEPPRSSRDTFPKNPYIKQKSSIEIVKENLRGVK